MLLDTNYREKLEQIESYSIICIALLFSLQDKKFIDKSILNFMRGT
jgi:hypothetical protein